MKEIADDPGYDGAADMAGKGTMLVFIATFAYHVLFSAARPGFLGGAVFFFVGIFAAPMLIAMPLFFLRAKVGLGVVFSFVEVVLTIVVTRAVYLWLFASAPPVTAAAAEPFLVACQEPVPEFTLGYESDLTDEEVSNLCACVWERLGTWEKATSRAFTEGREADVSWLNRRAFPARFGGAVEACGGMDL